eukprot:12482867-Alexandrium_andersonii.AAC.1
MGRRVDLLLLLILDTGFPKERVSSCLVTHLGTEHSESPKRTANSDEVSEPACSSCSVTHLGTEHSETPKRATNSDEVPEPACSSCLTLKQPYGKQ